MSGASTSTPPEGSAELGLIVAGKPLEKAASPETMGFKAYNLARMAAARDAGAAGVRACAPASARMRSGRATTRRSGAMRSTGWRGWRSDRAWLRQQRRPFAVVGALRRRRIDAGNDGDAAQCRPERGDRCRGLMRRPAIRGWRGTAYRRLVQATARWWRAARRPTSRNRCRRRVAAEEVEEERMLDFAVLRVSRSGTWRPIGGRRARPSHRTRSCSCKRRSRRCSGPGRAPRPSPTARCAD